MLLNGCMAAWQSMNLFFLLFFVSDLVCNLLSDSSAYVLILNPLRPQVVLDLGRPPLARFPSGDKKLSTAPVTKEDLDYAIAQVRWKAWIFKKDTLQEGCAHSFHHTLGWRLWRRQPGRH